MATVPGSPAEDVGGLQDLGTLVGSIEVDMAHKEEDSDQDMFISSDDSEINEDEKLQTDKDVADEQSDADSDVVFVKTRPCPARFLDIGARIVKKEPDEEKIIELEDGDEKTQIVGNEVQQREASQPNGSIAQEVYQTMSANDAGKEGDVPTFTKTEEELISELTLINQKRTRLLETISHGQPSSVQSYQLHKFDRQIREREKKLGIDDDNDEVDIDENLHNTAHRNRLAEDLEFEPDEADSRNASPHRASAEADITDEVTGKADESFNETSNQAKVKKTRRKPAKSAKEYWKRWYVDHNPEGDPATSRHRKRPVPDAALPKKNKRRKKNASKGKQQATTKEKELHRLLRQSDPIMARAALGNIPIPGPIAARRKEDQFAALKASVLANSGKQAKADGKSLEEAAKSFGFGKCKAHDGKWLLTGMKTALYNHQVEGASWMCKREFSPHPPFGGILADDMGVGKTVTTIAAMCANQPDEDDKKEGRIATLIVAPANIIPQWMKALQEHPGFIRKVFPFRGRIKIGREFWEDSDVVICSYNEVANCYPSDEDFRRISAMKLEGHEDWEEEWDKVMGDLFSMKFHRIVLDEAHHIKNHLTRTSKACIAINARYRWAVTGTPIQNGVDELFPYLKFLGAEWVRDFEEFKKKFGDVEEDTVRDRLAAVIPTMMLRRRADDKFMGRPILEIPAPYPTQYVMVDLSEEERTIYRRLESRFLDNLKRQISQGVAKKNMHTYFSCITRLRQIVAHPFLIENAFKSSFTLEDIRWIRSRLEQYGRNAPVYQEISRWRQNRVEESSEDDNPEGTEGTGKQSYGFNFSMDRQLELVEKGKTVDELICRVCYETPILPRLSRCGHTFCSECLEVLQDEATEAGKEVGECPSCGNSLLGCATLTNPESSTAVPDAASDGDQQENSFDKKQKKGKKKDKKKDPKPGDDANLFQPKSSGPSRFIAECDKNPDDPITPSAKTTAIMDKIMMWQQDSPEEKIILFTQWIDLARILGRMLSQEGIKFLYYIGNLSRHAKDQCVTKFEKDPDIKVLISSIRSGGQALNLTCASRVILADLWWNKCIEDQAFGRVHRIGQTRRTQFVKIVTRNTIDQRLLDMQKVKQQIIAAILENHAALSLEDIRRLFGDEEVDDAEQATADEDNRAEISQD